MRWTTRRRGCAACRLVRAGDAAGFALLAAAGGVDPEAELRVPIFELGVELGFGERPHLLNRGIVGGDDEHLETAGWARHRTDRHHGLAPGLGLALARAVEEAPILLAAGADFVLLAHDAVLVAPDFGGELVLPVGEGLARA